jgi:hypothetical protein
MKIRADYMSRYFYWRGNGCSHIDAKQKAINEMINYGFIKNEEDLYKKIKEQEDD